MKEVRQALLEAHEALLAASELLGSLRNLRNGETNNRESIQQESGPDFVELGSVWQAPFYEIVLNVHEDVKAVDRAGLILFLRKRNLFVYFYRLLTHRSFLPKRE